jgi:hypothetical protein
LTTAGSSVLATAIPAPAIAALLSCNQVEPPRRRAAVAAAMTASPSSSPMAGVGTVVGSAASAGIDADSEGTAPADVRRWPAAPQRPSPFAPRADFIAFGLLRDADAPRSFHLTDGRSPAGSQTSITKVTENRPRSHRLHYPKVRMT